MRRSINPGAAGRARPLLDAQQTPGSVRRSTSRQRLNRLRTASVLSAWRDWLEANHARAEGVGLIRYKANAARSVLSFAPRRAGSRWSRLNRERVAELEAEGPIAPAGGERIDARSTACEGRADGARLCPKERRTADAIRGSRRA